MIPNARPSLGAEELSGIEKVFASGWLGMGSVVFEFEKALKEYLGAGYVIAVNTGTSALHIALDALGIKDKDEVLVPSLTFVGSIQPIIECGARPVFCEVSPDTLNMDIEDMASRINKKTKVIMPIHYGGQPCAMDEILAIAQKFSLRVVEDAAHAFGSFYKDKKIGSFGDIACFSFDPIKNITCGEGGAVVTGDEAMAQLVIKKRILGIDKDTWSRYRNERSWFYEVVSSGYRYHMSNINAAIGLAQLKKVQDFIRKKREICRLYDAAFRDIDGLGSLKRDYDHIAPFNYVIKVKEGRDDLLNYLKGKGIDAGIHYIPNHLHPVFKKYSSALPATEELFRQILTLPLFADMEKPQVDEVIREVRSFFKDG